MKIYTEITLASHFRGCAAGWSCTIDLGSESRLDTRREEYFRRSVDRPVTSSPVGYKRITIRLRGNFQPALTSNCPDRARARTSTPQTPSGALGLAPGDRIPHVEHRDPGHEELMKDGR